MMWETTYCPGEISPACPGHQGWEKLDSCLLAALYHADHDATCGDVDGFGWWSALIIQDKAETLESADCPVTIPAATYWVIQENDQGHVYVCAFDTAEQAQTAYDAHEAAYGAWLDASDAREYAITSSTGRIGA